VYGNHGRITNKDAVGVCFEDFAIHFGHRFLSLSYNTIISPIQRFVK
jgi:hypothetical protein